MKEFVYDSEYYDDVPQCWKCKDCIHFSFVVPGKSNGCQKRVDHIRLEGYSPYFVSVTEENLTPCLEFIPKRKKNGKFTFKSAKHYLAALERSKMNKFTFYELNNWHDYVEHHKNSLFAFMLNKDRSMIYWANYIQYLEGKHMKNGKLKCYAYSKQVRLKNGLYSQPMVYKKFLLDLDKGVNL